MSKREFQAAEYAAECATLEQLPTPDRSVFALGGKMMWVELAKQLADVWWKVSKVGGNLQHGDLELAATMFSVVLESHGGRCFHGETPDEAWCRASDWMASPVVHTCELLGGE